MISSPTVHTGKFSLLERKMNVMVGLRILELHPMIPRRIGIVVLQNSTSF